MVRLDELPASELVRFQNKSLDMMAYLYSVCVENGINYYLDNGSCLGAIRHNGFIPWDDDFDIMMPRADYEKLWSIWNDKYSDSGFVLCRTTKEQCIKFHIMQLRDSNTTFVYPHSVGLDICHGIKIDICPIDAVPNNKIAEKIQKINTMIFALFATQRVPNREGGKYAKGTAKILLSIIISPKIRYFLWSRAEKSFTKYDYDNAEYVRCLNSRLMKKDILGKPTMHKFDRCELYVPEDYDGYLKWKYGDYMKLPPAEQRKPYRTVLEYYDLDTPYKEYLKNIT